MNHPFKEYVVYLFSDTEDFDTDKQILEADLQTLLGYADRNGLHVHKAFMDSPHSGKPFRALFHEMLWALKYEGPHGILVADFHQLCKTGEDYVALMNMFARRSLLEITVPVQRINSWTANQLLAEWLLRSQHDQGWKEAQEYASALPIPD